MLVCPDPEYRQRPRLPSSMTRWKAQREQDQNCSVLQISTHYMMDTNFKTTLWNTGRRKAWQQKRHTPSKLRHCGHRLWLRLRDDISEEKGKKKSQPSTPEAETNWPPEREDNDQGCNDFVEDSHCQRRRRPGGGRTSSCPALTVATSLLGTASRGSAWPCLKLTGAVYKIALKLKSVWRCKQTDQTRGELRPAAPNIASHSHLRHWLRRQGGPTLDTLAQRQYFD